MNYPQERFNEFPLGIAQVAGVGSTHDYAKLKLAV